MPTRNLSSIFATTFEKKEEGKAGGVYLRSGSRQFLLPFIIIVRSRAFGPFVRTATTNERTRVTIGERRNAKTVLSDGDCLSNKITKNRIVLSFKDSPRQPLRRRPYFPLPIPIPSRSVGSSFIARFVLSSIP